MSRTEHRVGRVADKIAFVTGAGSIGEGWGNGKAAAALYAREGASVFCIDVDEDAARATADVIAQEGGRAHPFQADVTREEDVQDAVADCLERFGRIDILHNNVGGGGSGRTLSNITVDDWDITFARNVTSVMLTCRAVVPVMTRQGAGAIVNISSIGAIRYLNAPMAVYAAAKGAVNEFTRNIALQHAKDGIRANCVLPGYIDTPFIRRTIDGKPAYMRKGYSTAEDYASARDALVPLGRMGTAWDVAHAALFLASDDAAYVTGTEIVVDGGVTAVCPGA